MTLDLVGESSLAWDKEQGVRAEREAPKTRLRNARFPYSSVQGYGGGGQRCPRPCSAHHSPCVLAALLVDIVHEGQCCDGKEHPEDHSQHVPCKPSTGTSRGGWWWWW